MAGRGRGRGRGFGRGKLFANVDQLNLLPPEKPSSQYSTPYPPLEYYPASLLRNTYYDDLYAINSQVCSYFQSSSYHFKKEDETEKLFSSQGESTVSKKPTLNFNWDLFPLELRPTGKRKLKSSEEILKSLRKNKMVHIDLAWLDKLEENENIVVGPAAVADEEVKKDPNENLNEEEEIEFDDEELDMDNDYNTNYFDNGEDYMDDDNDPDEGPYF